jgi:hypothetical protein
MEQGRYTVEAEVGEVFTDFKISPPVSLAKLIGLPQPQYYGGTETKRAPIRDVQADQDGVSVATFDSRAFHSGGSFYDTDRYSGMVAAHLDRLAAAEDAAIAA